MQKANSQASLQWNIPPLIDSSSNICESLIIPPRRRRSVTRAAFYLFIGTRSHRLESSVAVEADIPSEPRDDGSVLVGGGACCTAAGPLTCLSKTSCFNSSCNLVFFFSFSRKICFVLLFFYGLVWIQLWDFKNAKKTTTTNKHNWMRFIVSSRGIN